LLQAIGITHTALFHTAASHASISPGDIPLVFYGVASFGGKLISISQDLGVLIDHAQVGLMVNSSVSRAYLEPSSAVAGLADAPTSTGRRPRNAGDEVRWYWTTSARRDWGGSA
jgi:hypothetical protein